MYALAAFGLIVLALPPLSLEVAAYLFFVPMLLGFDRRGWAQAGAEASMLGACVGAYAYFGAYAEGLGLYVLAIAVTACLFGVCGVITARILQLRSLALVLFIPVIWAAGELLVNQAGLPFELALTLDDSLVPLQLASLGGPWLVTMFILFVQVAGFLSVRLAAAQAWRRAGLCAGLVVAAITCVYEFGHARTMLYDKAPGNGVNVSIAQTNLPPQLLHGSAEQGRLEIIIAQHRLLERRLQRRADGDASIAVWPESAMPGLRVVVPNDTRVSKTGFHSVLHTYGMSAASELVSEVQVVDARGHTASRAYKVRPVPIAEKALRGGDKPILHRSLGIPFGALVCYESAFPDLARHLVARGARWLAVLTNDAFEWPSFLSHLNHALARLRAIENGVVVARAANGGVSVIFSPTGGVRAEVAPFDVGIATSTIESLDSTTFYTRHGGLIETLVLAIAATLVTAAMVPASAGGVQQKGNEGHPHPRWYPAVAVVLMMAAVSSANYWQFNMMVGAHELHETPSFSARHSNNSPYTNSLAAALNQVHRRYGFLTTRQPHPQSQADLARWAAAHGLETRTGTLDDTHPALRYAMTGLLRLASGDLAVITARRDDDFRLYLPHGSEYRWVPLQRLVRMQRGPVLWFLPKAQKNPLLAVRLD